MHHYRLRTGWSALSVGSMRQRSGQSMWMGWRSAACSGEVYCWGGIVKFQYLWCLSACDACQHVMHHVICNTLFRYPHCMDVGWLRTPGSSTRCLRTSLASSMPGYVWGLSRSYTGSSLRACWDTCEELYTGSDLRAQECNILMILNWYHSHCLMWTAYLVQVRSPWHLRSSDLPARLYHIGDPQTWFGRPVFPNGVIIHWIMFPLYIFSCFFSFT